MSIEFQILIGIIKIASTYVIVLFDPGATDSFISSGFVRKINIVPVPLTDEILVFIPNGNNMVINMVCPSCTFNISGHDLVSNLLVLEMKEFDIILEMDWLASYHAIVDCFQKEVIF